MDIYYRKQALKFLRVCLLSQLNLPGCVTDVGQTPRQLSTLLRSSVDSSWHRSEAVEIKVSFKHHSYNLNFSWLDSVLFLSHDRGYLCGRLSYLSTF